MTKRTNSTGPQVQLAFATPDEAAAMPSITVQVNFGVLTGREATPAEIDQLADRLLGRAEHVTIISEAHHEIDRRSEASVNQVRIEVPEPASAPGSADLERWLVREAERWARRCAAERAAGTGGIDPEL